MRRRPDAHQTLRASGSLWVYHWVMAPLYRLWQTLIDALIPPRRTEVLIAGLTPQALHALRAPRFMNGVEALLPYDDARVRALIWELKYFGSQKSVELLGEVLRAEIPALVAEELSHEPLLIPVPLHQKRQRSRGFNQAERVAAHIAQGTDALIHRSDVLRRTVDTPRQTALSRTRRLTNVAGAFSVTDPSAIKGRVCIVLDDVVTTGSTLKAAGRALEDAGASRVILLALAHAG
jgi:ComF family protein